ncbi:MAG: protoheme IX farnesyltransferase [Isosphaera sp.]|nr:protoheme IX farnesyltransferase [Isosphaera sp.]
MSRPGRLVSCPVPPTVLPAATPAQPKPTSAVVVTRLVRQPGVWGPATADARAALRRRVALVLELSKPRITRLVTLTAAIGFVLSLFGRAWGSADLALTAAGCALGTALSAAGANTLNQWWERRRDGLMRRTATRPLPTGRVSPFGAAAIGALLSLCGCATLTLCCGLAPAGVSALTIAVYVLLYTPIKPLTPLSTLVGAVPGALPPLIGWTAAANTAGPVVSAAGLAELGGWSLFVLMFVWQVPHFLAIAWMHREEYARGGFRMLPLFDPSGRFTSLTIVLWSALLLPATLAPAWILPDRLAMPYILTASITGGMFLAMAARLLYSPDRGAARALFIASIVHLPVLLLAMSLEVLLRMLLR